MLTPLGRQSWMPVSMKKRKEYVSLCILFPFINPLRISLPLRISSVIVDGEVRSDLAVWISKNGILSDEMIKTVWMTSIISVIDFFLANWMRSADGVLPFRFARFTFIGTRHSSWLQFRRAPLLYDEISLHDMFYMVKFILQWNLLFFAEFPAPS